MNPALSSREISIQVLRILKENQNLTFDQVSHEFFQSIPSPFSPLLQQRLSSIFHVLKASGIIKVDESGKIHVLEPIIFEDQDHLRQQVLAKKAHLSELLVQKILLNELIRMNTEEQVGHTEGRLLSLPFLVVVSSLPQKPTISVSENKCTLTLAFAKNANFSLLDDVAILKQMHLLENISETRLRELVQPELLSLLPDVLQSKLTPAGELDYFQNAIGKELPPPLKAAKLDDD